MSLIVGGPQSSSNATLQSQSPSSMTVPTGYTMLVYGSITLSASTVITLQGTSILRIE